MAIHPYIIFSGNCRQAFEHYQQVLGGQLEWSKFADVPADSQMPGADPEQIMHVTLSGDDIILMGSDDPTGDDGPKVGVAVAFVGTDIDKNRAVFDGLSAGGTVEMPFGPTFWSPGFGMCRDQFGVPWMVDTEHTNPE